MLLVHKIIIAVKKQEIEYSDFVQQIFRITTATVFESINI